MARLMAVHLSVVIFAICLLTQVLSQVTVSENATLSPPENQTMPMDGNATDVATNTYGSSVNATTAPTGIATLPQSGPFSLLLPISIVTGLLHHC